MNRLEIAKQAIQNDGRFVTRIETVFRGRKLRVTRLYDKYGQLVRGVGPATMRQLSANLRHMTTWRTSDWPVVMVRADMPRTDEETKILEQRERESWYYQD